jgi:sec-independent protein translocase protein TatC
MTNESNDKPESETSAKPISRRIDRADYYSAPTDTPRKESADGGGGGGGSGGGGGTSAPLVGIANSGDSDGSKGEDGLGFLEHLEELRWRLIKIIVGVVIAGGIALYFGQEIFEFAIVPLGDLELHVTSITGSFYAYIIVSLFAGIFAAAPFVFYQLWAFVAPGLYKNETRFILPAVFASSGLFALGSWFCYRYVLPFAIAYLVSFGEGALTPIITISSYLTFAGMMVLSFGAAFNMPVVSFFLAKMNLLRTDTLAKGRRVAVVAILVFAAIITPPDVFTQILIGGPMYVLFEVSIIVVRIVNHNKESPTLW